MPVIKGIGGSMLYLVDRYGAKGEIYDAELRILARRGQESEGLRTDLRRSSDPQPVLRQHGEVRDFYERLFNFREIRYFDIKGVKTGLVSKAMTAPDGMVRIPLNESQRPQSQINEYLDEYKGEGIQHIACFTEDIYTTVEAMRKAGVEFLDTPDAYFEMIDERVPNHGEDVAAHARRTRS